MLCPNKQRHCDLGQIVIDQVINLPSIDKLWGWKKIILYNKSIDKKLQYYVRFLNFNLNTPIYSKHIIFSLYNIWQKMTLQQVN